LVERLRVQELAAPEEVPFSLGIGEEAIAADAHEALGKDMEQEASNELVDLEAEGTGSAPAGVVLIPEGHRPLLQGEKPAVGDGDPVGIAREIFQDLVRATEGRLGIDHPFSGACLDEEPTEHTWIRQRSERSAEREMTVVEGLPQEGEELAPEEPTQDPDREKEARAAVDPVGAVPGETAGRDYAVEMGMVVKCLAPGV
jgi:hypothetical protein